MDIVKMMPEEYHHFSDRIWKMRTQEDRELVWKVDSIMRSFQTEMQSWFKIAGYDYEHIPAAPKINHTRRKMKEEETEAWKERVQKHLGKYWQDADYFRSEPKATYQIGQLVYLGRSDQRNGQAKLFLLTGVHFCSFYPQHGWWSKELTEAVWKTAEEISKITDWSMLASQPKKVRRAAEAKMRNVIRENKLEEYFRLS